MIACSIMLNIGAQQSKQLQTYTEIVEKGLAEGVESETKRFKAADQFPVNKDMAEIHYKANWFGMRAEDQERVCPCCLERVKDKQFDFWRTSMDNNFLTTDIILFFEFIKILSVYMLIKLMFNDGYNIYMNLKGTDCGRGIQQSCHPTFFSRASTQNRMSDTESLFITDLLNLAFVIISIVFWTVFQRKHYMRYVIISAEIQSEDDYTVYVQNIPVVQTISEGVIDYKRALKDYFNSIVTKWLENPTDDELYRSYVKVAREHNHGPKQPPKIVTHINLCWNLYELTAIHDLKDGAQDKYEVKAMVKDADQKVLKNQFQQIEMQVQKFNQTQIQLCQKFQMNDKFGFALSRFLGKAFVSFQYQHFAYLVDREIVSANHFMKDVTLETSKAVFPTNVYWENLNVTDSERRSRTINTYLLTTGCLILAFVSFLTIKYVQTRRFRTAKHNFVIDWAWSLSTSLLSVVISIALYWVIDQLSLFQEHDTKTRYEVSYVYKAISAVICNQIINICIAHWYLKIKIWSAEGLTLQIINTLIIWWITQMTIQSLYLNWVLRWLKLKWRYRSEPILKFQNRYNLEYQLPTFSLAYRYSSYLSNLYFLCFFGYLAPIGDVIGVLMFCCGYFIDKINILKRSTYHSNYSYYLIDKSVHLAQSSILLFSLGNYLFAAVLTGNRYNDINLLSIGISLVYFGVIWSSKFNMRCFEDYIVYEQMSFGDCIREDKFFDTFQSLNPATKLISKQRRDKLYLGVNTSPGVTKATADRDHSNPVSPELYAQTQDGQPNNQNGSNMQSKQTKA